MSVADIQAKALTYADIAQHDMQTFFTNMENANQDLTNIANKIAGELSANRYTYQFGDPLKFPEAPELTAEPPTPPQEPDAPSLAELGTVVSTFALLGTHPTFMLADPVLDLPVPPIVSLPSPPAAPADAQMPAIPDAPQIALPDVPTLQSIAIPDAPTVVLPTFTAEIEDAEFTAPTGELSFYEQRYQSALLDAAVAELLDNLQNGGYGINPADEEPLWERERERELRAAEQQVRALRDQAAARGFMMPPGTLELRQDSVVDEAHQRINTASRDVALKRADLYVQNRQFTIEQVQRYEQMLIGYYGSMMERALNAQRATVDAAIAAFNARVAKQNLTLETFRAKADMFRTQLQAALSHLEAYKIRVEGAKLASDLQRANVELYNAQLGAVRTAVDVFRAQMEAAKVHADIEETKVNIFRGRVQAYVAEVQAQTARYDMYKAQISGEVAKLDIHRSRLASYTAQLEAYKSRMSVEEARANLQIRAAELRVTHYRAKLEGFSTVQRVKQEEFRSLIDQYRAEIQAFTADVQRYSTETGDMLRLREGEVKSAEVNAQALLTATQARYGVLEASSRINASLATGGANASASALASALSAAAGLEVSLNNSST